MRNLRARMTVYLLLPFAIVLGASSGSRAQCFREPILEVLAATLDPPPGPFPTIGCIHPINPFPCVKPPAPTIVTLGGDSTLTQEVKLVASRPKDTDGDGSPNEFDEVFWVAENWDPSTPGWFEIWRKLSKDSKAARSADETTWTVRFGATGLLPGRTHRFAVAYCRFADGVRGCSCWSDYATMSGPTPSGFPDVKPTPPASTLQRAEDTFTRPYQTSPKFVSATVQGGDGLGPDGAWQDQFSSGSAGNGSYVKKVGSTTFALMPQGAAANYVLYPSAHEHSYAEALFDVEPAQSEGYNFDLRARIHYPAGGVRAYVAKLHYKLYGATTAPRLTIFRSNLVAPNPGNEDLGTIAFQDDADATADYHTHCANVNCKCWPEMQKLSGTIRPPRPIWLRIEVDDTSDVPAVPMITATAAWDDSDHPCTGDIGTCPYRCTVQLTDNSALGLVFAGQQGYWGLDTHERNYRVYRFRAGNETP